ncbi:hypothetical protein EJ07DRAFT_173747 [Lizonia empirigonia]|nr:hypothetical protein EJ07DRAFT_173747 [Lizonia empirigonia]
MYAGTMLLLASLAASAFAAPISTSQDIQNPGSLNERADLSTNAASLNILKRGPVVEVVPVEARAQSREDDIEQLLEGDFNDEDELADSDTIEKRSRSQGGHSGGKRDLDEEDEVMESNSIDKRARAQGGHTSGKRERTQGGHSDGKRGNLQ